MNTREIDWRFLLPSPSAHAFDHLVLLGGSPQITQTILDVGVARTVSHTIRSGIHADAVVGLAGADISIADASRAVGDNGVLYWEVDRRTPASIALTPRRMTRELNRLGLTPVASYWVNRCFSQRLLYLPLNGEGPLTWYLGTLFRTPTLTRQIARQALTATAKWCAWSAVAPCYAVTAIRGEHRMPAVLSRAAAEGVPIGPGAQAVFLAYGSTEWNRLVVLVFEPGGRAPVAAIKLPRTSAFNGEIEWEHAVLRTLGSDLPSEIAASIPRSQIFGWNGLAVSAETCVKGSSLNCRVRHAEEAAPKDLHRVVEWLAAFHQHTTSARVNAKQWAREHFARVCREYSATFGLTQAEARLFDGVLQCIDGLGDETLPLVWQHADFGPPNLYLDDEKVSVIDWETARPGAALQDLLYLVADWTAAVTGRTANLDAQHNFRSLYCSDARRSRFVDSVHAEIAEYMRRVGVAPSLFHVLLVLTFVDQALERVRRLSTLGSPGATIRDANRFVACVEILAANAPPLSKMATMTGAADVTVAVATMNRPAALVRCVETILAAPQMPGELVIVDQSDGSETAQLITLSRWGDRVPLRYIRQCRRGLAASRNAAVSVASRQIVAFTDDDCVPGEGWLDALVAAFNTADRPDAVTGRVLPLGPERPGRYAVSTRASEVRTLYRTRTHPWSIGSGGNAAVTREWLRRIGPFDERLGAGSPGQSAEDMDLFYRLLRYGASVLYEPKVVVYHERKDRQRRLETRPAYGFGMGAFCALSARHRDAYVVWILTRWSCDRVRALLAGCVRGQWNRVLEESLMLRGAARGFAYGIGRGR